MNVKLSKVIAIFMILCITPVFILTSSASAGHNIYKGILCGDYDTANTDAVAVQMNGSVDISKAGAVLTYKDVNFNKPVSHISINYATGAYVNPRKVKFMTDNVETGTVLCDVILEDTGAVNDYVTVTYEVTADISGVHDVILVCENASPARILNFKCTGTYEQTAMDEAFEYPKQIHLLKALGILDYGFLNQSVQNTAVTRREFSVYLSRLLGVNGTEALNFYDVDSDDEDICAMSLMHALGALEAKDNRFFPERGVTVGEACEAVLKILGYSAKNSRYYSLALSLKMLSGINKSQTQKLTRYDFVLFSHNTLSVSVPEIEFTDNSYSYSTTNSGTVLSKIHKVWEQRGIINGNSQSYLTRHTNTTSENQVLIDNTIYGCRDSKSEEYLGCNVRYYLKEIEGVNTVICIMPRELTNKIEIVDADDIVDFDNNKLTYEENGRNQTLSFSNTADVLYNGVCFTSYTKNDFLISEGEIEFIDNDSDGSFEVISIKAGKDFVIDSIDMVNDIVFFKKLSPSPTDPTFIFTKDDSIENCIILLNGNIVGVEDLKEGDVVTLYDSKIYGGVIKNRKLSVSDKIHTKIINEVKYQDNKTYYVASDGTEYEKSKNTNQNVTVGNEYSIHISQRGKAVWFENAVNRDFKYGYVMNIGIDNGTFENVFKMKILTEDSEIKEIKAASKVECDGDMYTNGGDLNTYLLDGETRYPPQIIRYRLNSAGEIIFVDTAKVGRYEDSQTSLVKNMNYNSGEYKSSTGYFWHSSSIDDNTVAFITPLYQTNAAEMIDSVDDSDFQVKKAKQFAGMSGYSEGYDGSLVKPLGAMILYKSNRDEFQETSPMVYITKTSTVLDRKGNPTKRITGISQGQTVNLILNEAANKERGHQLEPGDLWIYNLDLKNEVTFLEPLWSKDGTDYNSAYPLHTTTLNRNNLYIAYASDIVDRYKKNVALRINGLDYGYSLEQANIILHDKTSGKISNITPEAIATNEQVQSTGKNQYAFIYAYQRVVTQVIIVQE